MKLSTSFLGQRCLTGERGEGEEGVEAGTHDHVLILDSALPQEHGHTQADEGHEHDSELHVCNDGQRPLGVGVLRLARETSAGAQ